MFDKDKKSDRFYTKPNGLKSYFKRRIFSQNSTVFAIVLHTTNKSLAATQREYAIRTQYGYRRSLISYPVFSL